MLYYLDAIEKHIEKSFDDPARFFIRFGQLARTGRLNEKEQLELLDAFAAANPSGTPRIEDLLAQQESYHEWMQEEDDVLSRQMERARERLSDNTRLRRLANEIARDKTLSKLGKNNIKYYLAMLVTAAARFYSQMELQERLDRQTLGRMVDLLTSPAGIGLREKLTGEILPLYLKERSFTEGEDQRIFRFLNAFAHMAAAADAGVDQQELAAANLDAMSNIENSHEEMEDDLICIPILFLGSCFERSVAEKLYAVYNHEKMPESVYMMDDDEEVDDLLTSELDRIYQKMYQSNYMMLSIDTWKRLRDLQQQAPGSDAEPLGKAFGKKLDDLYETLYKPAQKVVRPVNAQKVHSEMRQYGLDGGFYEAEGMNEVHVCLDYAVLREKMRYLEDMEMHRPKAEPGEMELMMDLDVVSCALLRPWFTIRSALKADGFEGLEERDLTNLLLSTRTFMLELLAYNRQAAQIIRQTGEALVSRIMAQKVRVDELTFNYIMVCLACLQDEDVDADPADSPRMDALFMACLSCKQGRKMLKDKLYAAFPALKDLPAYYRRNLPPYLDYLAEHPLEELEGDLGAETALGWLVSGLEYGPEAWLLHPLMEHAAHASLEALEFEKDLMQMEDDDLDLDDDDLMYDDLDLDDDHTAYDNLDLDSFLSLD